MYSRQPSDEEYSRALAVSDFVLGGCLRYPLLAFLILGMLGGILHWLGLI